MERQVTVEYEGTTTVLTRASVSDGRVRRKLFAALGRLKLDEELHAGTWCYYITQLVSTNASADQKMVVCPDDEGVRELFEDWSSRTDELFGNKLSDGVMALVRDTSEKKQSGNSPNGTQEAEKTPILSMTTPQSQ